MNENLRLDVIEFSVYGMKFMRDITLIFFSVDVALRYHLDGLKDADTLIAIALTVFGIYGLMSYGIKRGNKYLEFKRFRQKWTLFGQPPVSGQS